MQTIGTYTKENLVQEINKEGSDAREWFGGDLPIAVTLSAGNGYQDDVVVDLKFDGFELEVLKAIEHLELMDDLVFVKEYHGF